MKKNRLTPERQQRFLSFLGETGNVSRSLKLAGTSRPRVYTLRQNDPAFRQAWDQAEEIAADRLEEEAWRRAVEGFDEPVVSGGKLVRDEAGNAVMVRRYSDTLLLALLRARRPGKFNKRLSADIAVTSSAVSFDVRTMLLTKLAQLATHTEAEDRRLLEYTSEADAIEIAEPAAPRSEDA
jgi:hypothetical protein